MKFDSEKSKWMGDYRDEFNQRHRRFFTSRADAALWEQQGKAQTTERKKTPTISRVSNLVDSWLELHKHPNEVKAARELKIVAGSLQLRELNAYVGHFLVSKWKGESLSAHTRYNYRHALRRLFKYLVANGASREILEDLPTVKQPDYRQVVLNGEEHLALLEKTASAEFEPWFRCFLLGCLYLGLRRSESLRIAPVHYDPVTKAFDGLKTKNDRTQNLPLVPQPLRALFESVLPAADPKIPFVQILAGRPVSSHQISLRWKKLKQIAGIRANVMVHDLRRTLATHIMEDEQGGLLAAQQVLNHKDLSSTKAYLAFRRSPALGEAMERFANPHKMLPFPAKKKIGEAT